jgi:multidrug efflux pump subunit AcrB
MPSMIGLIMLMGIATKNSILLVDYVILARREHGMARCEAILDACHKRAQPIVMTTIAMGAGMVPDCAGHGVDRPELSRAHGHRRDWRPHHQSPSSACW